MRFTLILATILAVASASVTAGAVEYATFTEPTKINILERFSPGWAPGMAGTYGTYYYPEEKSYGSMNYLSGSQWFRSGDAGLYCDRTQTLGDVGISGKIMFDTPVFLDTVVMEWRNQWDHVPTYWEVRDQTGVIGSGYRSATPGEFVKDFVYTIDYVNNPNRPASEFLEVWVRKDTPGAGDTGYTDLTNLKAYMSAGQNMPIDGTFNIFREEITRNEAAIARGEAPTMRVEAKRNNGVSFDPSPLTDGKSVNFNLADGSTPGGYIIWEFAQEYTFQGAYIMKENQNTAIDGFLLQVCTGQEFIKGEWVDVWEDVIEKQDWFRNGYITFDEEVTGDKFRMSWDMSLTGGGREIREFSLFGYATIVPEPATMTLLALGGLAMLRRRRV